MDNDSGALILLFVLIVSAFLLIFMKLTQFVNHFSREKQYLLTQMHRAADYNEYRYWRRELRCLYVWSRFCPCSFVLCGFGYIFDCNALSGVNSVILSSFGYLNIPNEFVMDYNPLTAIFADTLGFINCYFIYQFTKQGCSQLFHFHIPKVLCNGFSE